MRFTLPAVVFALALSIHSAEARLPTSLIEEFDTADYMSGFTTADWNTAAGKLRLFPFAPTLLGTCDTPVSATRVAVSGSLAYVTDGSAGLQIVSLSNPASPTIVGTYDTPEIANGVAVSGTRAYVADNGTGLLIIDVSNPAAPVLLGSYNTPGTALSVAVSGTVAYVADHTAGLHLVNVSNPAAPVLLGTYVTPVSCRDVVIAGTTAYVACAASGLLVLNVSNPAAPTLLGSYDTPDVAWGLALSGTVAYVADRTSGLQIINVANPASPALLGSYDTPNLANTVQVSGTTAYVADGGTGLMALDVRNPADPVLLAGYDTPNFADGVALWGTMALVADRTTGLILIRIASEVPPDRLGDQFTGQAQNCAVSGSRVYVADRSDGLRIIDATDPANPSLLGQFNTPGSAWDVAISGTIAYVADVSSLQIINVSNPAAPTLIGSFPTPLPSQCVAVAVSGTTAYLAVASGGLLVVNVGNPASPALIGSYNTPGSATGVAVSGTVAYVADGSSGLQIINVGNPAAPALLGNFDTLDFTLAVALSGSLALIADGTRGLRIVNVSNPAAPVLVGTYSTPDQANSVAVSGTVAYIADTFGGLQVVDFSIPVSPALIGTFIPSSTVVTGVAVSGPLVYLANQQEGLHIIQTRQSHYDFTRNVGWSTNLYNGPSRTVLVRLIPTRQGSVGWEISASHGFAWQPVDVFSSLWWPIGVISNGLSWRAKLQPTSPYDTPAGPEVSRLVIDWRYDHPVVDAVTDVGNDQGRHVRLAWTRSGFDYPGVVNGVIEYAIYRRIDPGLVPPLASVRAAESDPERAAALAEGWDYVATVPAEGDDSYSMVVPTLADSTPSAGQHWTAFHVRARTAMAVGYDSPPDSGYSKDNLAPNVPAGLVVSYQPGAGRRLDWADPVDQDFRYFNVYRSNDPDFVPGPATLVHNTTTTEWIDNDPSAEAIHYRLTAVDFSGNESAPGSASTLVGVEASATPARFALHAPMPNPFQRSAALRFDVPAAGGRVRLGIYDVLGRRVRDLLDAVPEGGQRSALWDGRDDAGRALPAGLYLCRMEAAGFSQVRRLMLAR